MPTPGTRSSTAEPYVKIPTSVLADPALSDRAVRLYGVLAHMQGRNAFSWPHRSTLAAQLGCGVTSVREALRELTTAGVLSIRHRYDETGARISSAYTVQTSLRALERPGVGSQSAQGMGAGAPTEVEPMNNNQGTTVLGVGISSHQPGTIDTSDDFDVSAAAAATRTAIRRHR